MFQLFQNALPNALGTIIAAIIIGVAGFVWKDKKPWVKWVAIIAIVAIIALLIGYQWGFKNITTEIIPIPNETSYIVPIETIPLTAFGYEGEDDQEVGLGDSHFYVLLDGNARPKYQLKYGLSPDADQGYAGFVFRFDEIQDWSEYESIEFTVEFAEDALADFTVRDKSDSVDYLRLGDSELYREEVIVETANNVHTITIPLDVLQGINLKAVKEIGFNAGYHFTTGQNEFIISNVNLIKQ